MLSAFEALKLARETGSKVSVRHAPDGEKNIYYFQNGRLYYTDAFYAGLAAANSTPLFIEIFNDDGSFVEWEIVNEGSEA